MIEHLQKQKEIGALKIGYAAQAELFVFASSQVSRLIQVIKTMDELQGATEVTPPIEVKKEFLEQYAQALSTVFFMTDSLKLHHHAFGKFPDWTKFLKNMPEQTLFERINKIQGDYDALGKMINEATCGRSQVGQRHNIYSAENVAFFESIKIEGEE